MLVMSGPSIATASAGDERRPVNYGGAEVNATSSGERDGSAIIVA
jgi:hypothetical protein